MPVARYFLFVGAVLMALLFAVDAFTPKTSMASSTGVAAAPVENPTLRIRSDHKWPERVVYDTSLPTIVPPKAEMAAVVPAPTPAPATEISAKSRVRESFAQFKPADEPKLEARPLPKRKVARVRTAPPVMRVAQQPHLGFFGNNFW